MNIILASQSPRRVELLKTITEDFTVEPSKWEEIIPDGAQPWEAVMHLARGKALEVAVRHREDLVIGADTVVAVDGQILGKPKDHDHCVAMLNRLSGRMHQVYTGVALIRNDDVKVFYDVTDVEFYPLSQEDILWYAGLDEPYDKAGGYGIQGKGGLLVKGIRGDYFNVMGFPLAKAARELRGMIQL